MSESQQILRRAHHLELERLRANFSTQLQQQTQRIARFEAEQNPLSLQRWLRGVGDTKLSNDGFSEICVVPQPKRSSFALSERAATHSDPTYHHLHDCTARAFSRLLEVDKTQRLIVVDRAKCDESLFVFESASLLKADVEAIEAANAWTLIDANVTLFPLSRDTQSVWLRCGEYQRRPRRSRYNHFLSFVPLKLRAPNLFAAQLSKLNALTAKAKSKVASLPNVVVFVVDSTSRSNFHRASVSTDDFLSRILSAAPSLVDFELFEFFRHSTVGWGTGINLMAIVDGLGVSDTENSKGKEKQDLFRFFDSLGYAVPAMDEYASVMDGDFAVKNESALFASAQWDQTASHTFYLSQNALDINCRRAQYFGSSAWVDFVLGAVNVAQPKYDAALPYFMVVHAEDNHRADGVFQFVLDRYFRKLIEGLDLANTVLHIVADHGSLVGSSTSTQLGRWEVTNPMSLLFVPRTLFSEQQTKNLRANQQRFVTHFDFHAFYKRIPLEVLGIEGEDLTDSVQWPTTHIDILNDVVSVNRSCADAGDIAKGFCFCDMPRDRELTPALRQIDAPLLEFVIDEINRMTGRGRFDCVLLDAKEFEVATHLEHEHGDVQIVVQRTLRDLDDAQREALRRENRILTYFAYVEREGEGRDAKLSFPTLERDGMRVALIERLDYFMFEQCITREYDIAPFKEKGSEFAEQFRNTNNALPPVVFVNTNHTQSLLREVPQINLRLCKCSET